MFDDIAKLISTNYVTDDVGNEIETRTSRQVFVSVGSIYQNEFFTASNQGLKPTYKMTLRRYDYSGETLMEYDGEIYTIYRTYIKDADTIELFLSAKVGVN